jgi:uncharacterized SAM-binding protein YcdF (DUF218 family)
MKLSEIQSNSFTDEEIQKIVYSGIEDNLLKSKYALVLGNSLLIKERTSKAVELYKNKRIEKIIFLGGKNGVSNQNNDNISEAKKMMDLAIIQGVNQSDILIEDESNNTFENIDNAFKMMDEEVNSLNNLVIITSEFHLKRCFAIIKKKLLNINISLVAAKDGFSDKDNWFLSDNSWNSGRSLATYEAGLLIKYAKENKIKDLEIDF